MSEWISVKDRVPDFDGEVIVAGEGDVGVTWVYAHWESNGPGWLNGHITHWMPLPDPPGDPCARCHNPSDDLNDENLCPKCVADRDADWEDGLADRAGGFE